MQQRSELDLRINSLWGWERYKSKRVVYSLAEALLSGSELPPVRVARIKDEENSFELDSRNITSYQLERPGEKPNLGGHHRACAYLLAGIPMPVDIVEVKERRPNGLDIRDVILVNDADIRAFYEGTVEGIIRDGRIIPVTSYGTKCWQEPAYSRFSGLEFQP